MIIYFSKNTINNKYYIGQTKFTLEKRKKEHKKRYKSKYNLFFYNSLKKYGWNNFIWEVIEECESKEELDEMEFHYIKQFHSHVSENGYNLTWGGDGNSCIRSKETKNKMSEAQQKRWKNSENIIEASKRQKKIMSNEEYKNKIIEKLTTTCNTEEYKRKQSKIMKELWKNDSFKENQMEIRNNKEWRKNLSNSVKKSWKNDIKRKKKMSEEVSERIKNNLEKHRKKAMKIWYINGKIVKDLKTWCKDRNINYNTFYHYKNKEKGYKGYYLKTI